MQTDDTLSQVDGVREDREQGDDKSASTEAVLSAAELTIDAPIDQNRKRPVARRRLQNPPERPENGSPVDANSPETPLADMSGRHLERSSLEKLSERAEDDATVGVGGPGSSRLGNKVEPDETWNLDRLAAFIRRRLRRTAEDAWRIGNALELAHRELTDERAWLRWLKKIGLAKSSAYRFLDLLGRYSLEEIQARPGVSVDRLLNEAKADDQAIGGTKQKTAAGSSKKRATAETAARKSAGAETGAETGTESAEEIGDDNSEDNADRDEEQQSPITDADRSAFDVFVLAVHGVERAVYVCRCLSEEHHEATNEYVLREGRQAEDAAGE